MGSENHTVNIMMNVILGRSFWLLHKLGWKPLAQFMQSSDMTSICKSKILNVAHLSGTHMWLRLRIQKTLQSFYSSSVAASLSVLKFFSYKGIGGSAASHCRSWCILKEAHSLWNLTSPTNGFEFPHTVKLLGTIDCVAQKQGQQLTSQLTSISGHNLNWRHLLARIPGKKHSLKISQGPEQLCRTNSKLQAFRKPHHCSLNKTNQQKRW